MSQQIIDIGQFPNDPSADAIRLAFEKVNNNFSDLYTGNAAAGVDRIIPGRGIQVTPTSGAGNVTLYSNIYAVGVESPNGTLLISGSPLTNSDNGNILIDINPAAVVEFDSLEVTGNITAGGTLRIEGNANIGGVTRANTVIMSGGLTVSQFTSTGALLFVNSGSGVVSTTGTDVFYDPAVNTLYVGNAMSVGGNITATRGTFGTLQSNTQASQNASVTYDLVVGSNVSAGTMVAAQMTANGLTVTTEAVLGDVANITITGGNAGEILSTDGAGNLSWVSDQTNYGNSNVAAYMPNYMPNFTGNIGTLSGNRPESIVANAITAESELTCLGVVTTDGMQTANMSATGTVSLPDVANVSILGGSLGQVLATDGTGNLSWESVTTSAAGSNGQLQFNSNGVFGAMSNLFVDGANNALTLDQMSLLLLDSTSTAVFGVDPVGGAAVVPNLMVTGALTGMGVFTTYGGLEVGGGNARIVPKLTAESGANLGDVANVSILGGSNAQVLTTDGTGNLSWTTASGGSANTGNIEFSGDNITSSSDNITLGSANANLTLNDNLAIASFGVITANGDYFSEGGDYTSATWTPNTVDITGMSQVMQDWFGNLSNYINVTVSLNGEAAVPVTGWGGGGGNMQLIVTGSPAVDPTAVTSMQFQMEFYNRFLLDADDGTFGIYIDDNFEIETSRDVRLTATDDIFIQGSDAVEIRNSSNAQPVTIVANYFGTSQQWAFGVDGNLDVPGNINYTGFASPAPSLNGFSSASFADSLSTSSLTATGSVNLGSIGSITITGGNAGQVMTTDGSGVLTWSNVSSPAAGSNGQLQFNANGAFGAASNLSYDSANAVLTFAETALMVTDANVATVFGVDPVSSAVITANLISSGAITCQGNLTTYANLSVLGDMVSGTANIYGTATIGNATVTGNVTVGGTTETRIKPRVEETTSVATLTIDGDTTDQYNLTAQAVSLTVDQPTGTPYDGQKLTIRIEDDGNAQSITWTTTAGAFRSVGAPLPTTTVATKTLYVGCIWNQYRGYWDVVSASQEA